MLPRADRIRTVWCGFATVLTGVGLRSLRTLRAVGRLVRHNFSDGESEIVYRVSCVANRIPL